MNIIHCRLVCVSDRGEAREQTLVSRGMQVHEIPILNPDETIYLPMLRANLMTVRKEVVWLKLCSNVSTVASSAYKYIDP